MRVMPSSNSSSASGFAQAQRPARAVFDAVEQARRAPGCLDFSITADLVDPGRIDVFERWESQAAVDAFRASGPSDEQQDAIVSGCVCEYDVTAQRRLL